MEEISHDGYATAPEFMGSQSDAKPSKNGDEGLLS